MAGLSSGQNMVAGVLTTVLLSQCAGVPWVSAPSGRSD